ncbi:DNA-processing protein DprA [Enterovirga aerilata]|uniref:DNA-protecting protein DprA n=1 Tax=Enterovirga aerilata TaxID=2730920 RepID=A0A849IA82_9HYPH|nr:DNA-processing protein DprA [Enterovirga sp. DB1703]NNM73309.1 DNA-protecting protein DprA [Enterovirga sp. DB1703]
MSGFALTDEQRLDWLRLIRSERVGPRTFRALVNQFGGARAALEALPDLARRAGRLTIRVATRAEAERERDALARLGGRFVAQGEPDYPKPLLAIDSAPPLLAVRGSAEALARPTVAIVGSRNASAAGGAFTERLAAELGRHGYVIVSGLARGIDTRAHKAALATGTVAVLAGGHERVYPSENLPLLDRILGEGGAAVSEMPIGWEPRGRDFPRRNRIVSGLSYGVVVVEAARRSGSLITARFALEQGREVFAVPGSPLDPRAEGTNDLIRSGATLCAGAEHVIAVIEPLLAAGPTPTASPGTDGVYREAAGLYGQHEELWDELEIAGAAPAPSLSFEEAFEEPAAATTDRERVLSLIGGAPIGPDEIARQSGLPVRTVQMVLVELDMEGVIDRHPGQTITLRPDRAARPV